MTVLFSLQSQAGGSGLNTAIIVNQNSSNSCELANYYCERRQVPPENVLRIAWPGGNISWSSAEFQSTLLDPLLAMLAARQLTNQIDYVVLSMDIPFQTVNGSAVNSTTSALFYGLKSDSGQGNTNSYAASEADFRNTRPASAPAYSFLSTLLTAGSLAQAKSLVDQGVASDGTFPSQTVVLAKSSDILRNVRYHGFDNAIFDARVRGSYSLMRTNSDSPSGQANLLGYQTGLANFSVSPQTFVPGAIADSMTSFGGIIFGPNGQTSLLAFIHAGAAGSYGTVTEPYPSTAKFPDPRIYFYQLRGFSLAECYYQSLVVPYQGLIVGEPLAAPFAQPASGQWLGLSPNALLTGLTPLALQFTATDSARPLQQVDLFVDGKYYRTLTNLAPMGGSRLNLTLAGYPATYTVPSNSSPASIAQALAALINAPSNPIATNVAATVHGDRIELRFIGTNASAQPATPSKLHVTGFAPQETNSPSDSPAGLAPFFALSTSAGAIPIFSRNICLPSTTCGMRTYSIGGLAQVGSWIAITMTKTNGTRITVALTNQSAGITAPALAGQLASAVNSTPQLQGSDGVTAEDVTQGTLGTFNLRARAPGLLAAGATVQVSGSATLWIRPLAEVALNENLSDLQPRTHLYIAAGATSLSVPFQLDTTALADGFHELTAVAYEGTHVRTQTRVSLPVRVQNSALTASLSLLDLPATAPVQGTYHLQVAANTNNVATITLFSTGGALETINNQSSPIFTVSGAALGAGLHPFHAIVRTATGLTYRTQTHWARLTP